MINASQITTVLKGQVLQAGPHDINVQYLRVDSRKMSHPDASVFIALISERRNGHQFVPMAYQAGVRCFIISEAPANLNLYPDAWFIVVENTLQALQQLGTSHRKQFQLPVIAITGSNGKTIVKEWLYQLLETDFNIVRSPKSYNSQLGVPISVWAIKPEHQLGIFEAGISKAGEMENLEKIIQPNIGIFTNIGHTHNEGFLNQRHKINEKLFLFRRVNVLIYNKDYLDVHDGILQLVQQRKTSGHGDITLLNWSRKTEAVLQIKAQHTEHGQTRIEALYYDAPCHLVIPFTDNGSIENAIHCWLTALHLGIPQATIEERMHRLTRIAMRLELLKGINHCTIINDSYNSDVSSLAIALDFLLQQRQHETKTLILSDILQSGQENDVYRDVAELVEQKKINRFIAIGDALQRNRVLFENIKMLRAEFYANTDDFLRHLDVSSFQQQGILIKGARKFAFEQIARRLQERTHQTQLEINLNALTHNLNAYKQRLKPGTRIMAMVKAFSYGIGTIELANKLQFEQVDYLAVAFADEGILLRKHGIQLPILVMNTDEEAYDSLPEWQLEPELFSFRALNLLLETLQRIQATYFPIHIKFDTGMHRLGFDESDLPKLIDTLKAHPQLVVKTVFSHLAGSDDQALDNFTQQQGEQFARMAQQLEDALGYSVIKHLCNSSGIVRHPNLHFDMVRLGLGLYGVDSSSTLPLETVGRLKTTIAQIKHVPQHETVGYNRKGILQRDSVIATVCLGYADGLPRRIGNGVGYMLVHGKPAPIVGNVCMDMCMLDVTDIPEAREGDSVWVFNETLSVKQLAAWAATIPYEILTGISQRVKRVYFEE
jgi:alanine racemase